MPHQPHHHPHSRYEPLFPACMLLSILIILYGFLLDSPHTIFQGLIKIVTSESSLITDYIELAGPGAAFVNAGIVTAISVLILHYTEDCLNGLNLTIVGLMAGFSLFGKNFINIWPIVLGTYLYAKSRRESFRKYVIASLMATCLSPVVSYIGLGNGFGNPIAAVLVGIVIGFIILPLSAYTYRIQNGMNLYNTGFACGLIAMMLVPLMDSMGATPLTYNHWASGYNVLFGLSLSLLCLVLIAIGFLAFGLPFWATWAGYRRLLQTSGRSPSDYLRMLGPGPVLVNIGVNGLVAMAIILLVGGDLNGPTLGGIFTIMGFGAFGKHIFNMVPPMLGVIIGGTFLHWNLSDSASQLAILFCTTLAPLSGYFGWQYGILAGFLHSSVVLFTASPVAGMNLYNNGFAGGLVAIVLYPLIIAIAEHRKISIQDEDFFEPLEHDGPVTPPKAHELVEEYDDSEEY